MQFTYGYMGVQKVVSIKQMFNINFLTLTSSNELLYWPFRISYLFILGEYCIMLHPKGNLTPSTFSNKVGVCLRHVYYLIVE